MSMTSPPAITRPHHGLVGATILAVAPLVVLANYTLPLGFPSDMGLSPPLDTSTRSWLLSGTAIGITITLIPSGRLADQIDARRVLQASSATLVVALMLAATSTYGVALIAARVVAGMASGAILSSSLACLPRVAPTPRRIARATRLWGAMIGGGIAVGPLLALLAHDENAWRVGFFLVAGVQAILVLAINLAVPRSRQKSSQPRRADLDVSGALGLAAGLGVFLYGLMGLRQASPTRTAFALGLGFAVLVLVFALEIRREVRGLPVVFPVSRLRQPSFMLPTAQSALLGFSVVSFMNYFGVWAAETERFDPAIVATAVLVSAGTSTAASLLTPSQAFVPRYGLRLDWAAAFSLCAIGMATFVIHTPTVTSSLLAFIASGAGLGILNAALARDALRAVPSTEPGLGAGVNNASRYLGNAVGTAALAAVGTGTSIVAPAAIAVCVALLGAVLAKPGGSSAGTPES